jgi:3-hydroxyacyl-CoA dehydrogenase
LVNEGARILEEGIAFRSSDIDMVWVNGYGFPKHRGGPMHYANELGLKRVLGSLRKFVEQDGQSLRWIPASLLLSLVTQDHPFS